MKVFLSSWFCSSAIVLACVAIMNNHSQDSDPCLQHPLQTTTFMLNDGIPRFSPISGGIAGGGGAANSAAPLPLFVQLPVPGTPSIASDDMRQSSTLALSQAPTEATFLAVAPDPASSSSTTTTTSELAPTRDVTNRELIAHFLEMRQQEQAQQRQRQLLEDSLIRSFLLQEQRQTERDNVLVIRLGEGAAALPHSFLQSSDSRLARNLVDHGLLARQVGVTTTPQPVASTNRLIATDWAVRVAGDAANAADHRSFFQNQSLVDPRPTTTTAATAAVQSEDSLDARSIYHRATLPNDAPSSQQRPSRPVLMSRTTSGEATTGTTAKRAPAARPPSRCGADSVEDESSSSFSDQDSCTPAARQEAEDASSSDSDCDTLSQQQEDRQPPGIRRNHDKNVDVQSAVIRSKQHKSRKRNKNDGSKSNLDRASKRSQKKYRSARGSPPVVPGRGSYGIGEVEKKRNGWRDISPDPPRENEEEASQQAPDLGVAVTTTKVPHSRPTCPRKRQRTKRKYNHESFPQKLHRIVTELEVSGRSNIASFLDDGGLRVQSRKNFVKQIMPLYYRATSWSSFRRQLVSYQFPLIDYGPNTGTFQNPLFLRGRPELCGLIERDDRYDRETKSSRLVHTENDS